MTDPEPKSDCQDSPRLLPVVECPFCGYDVRHLTQPARCSECGGIIEEEMLEAHGEAGSGTLEQYVLLTEYVVIGGAILTFLVLNPIGVPILFVVPATYIFLAYLAVTRLRRRVEPKVWIGPSRIFMKHAWGKHVCREHQQIRSATLLPEMTFRQRKSMDASDVFAERRWEAQASPAVQHAWTLHLKTRYLICVFRPGVTVTLQCTWAEAKLIRQRLEEWGRKATSAKDVTSVQ